MTPTGTDWRIRRDGDKARRYRHLRGHASRHARVRAFLHGARLARLEYARGIRHPATPCGPSFGRPELQATSACISPRRSLIRRIARANPAFVEPSAYS
jgi:hypothetical protein